MNEVARQYITLHIMRQEPRLKLVLRRSQDSVTNICKFLALFSVLTVRFRHTRSERECFNFQHTRTTTNTTTSPSEHYGTPPGKEHTNTQKTINATTYSYLSLHRYPIKQQLSNKMTIVYALVSRQKTVLAEYTATLGKE